MANPDCQPEPAQRENALRRIDRQRENPQPGGADDIIERRLKHLPTFIGQRKGLTSLDIADVVTMPREIETIAKWQHLDIIYEQDRPKRDKANRHQHIKSFGVGKTLD